MTTVPPRASSAPPAAPRARYLFGDSTPFPLDENFLDTGCAAVECAVALLRADEVRVEEKRLVAAVEQRTLQEVGHFEHFEATVRSAYAEPVDDLRSQIGLSAQRMTDALRKEIMSFRDAAIAKALETAALSRVMPAIGKFFERHQLPNTKWSIAWGVRLDGRGTTVAQVHARAPGDLDVSMDVAIPVEHAWSKAVRVSSLASGVGIHLIKKRVLRKPRVELETLDALYVTELIDLPGESSMTLRRSSKRTSVGLRIVYAPDGTVQVARIAEDGSRSAEPESMGPEDAAVARALFARVAGQLRSLVPHRAKLRAAYFRDVPLHAPPTESAPEGRVFEQPAAIARLLIESIAPYIREIARRSNGAGELALKRTLGDGRREELFVSYDTVLAGVAKLAPMHRALFDLFGLGHQDMPLLGEGGVTPSLMAPELESYGEPARVPSVPPPARPPSMRPPVIRPPSLPPPRAPRARAPMASDADVTVQRPFYRPTVN
ncbi:MAG: hypothetical protein U0414_37195 [Polyangiaceae bacterium]